FDGAELWVIDKAGLIATHPTVKFALFSHLRIAGHSTLAPQPALSLSRPHAEFMLSSLDFDNKGDHRLGLWAVTHRTAVAAGGLRPRGAGGGAARRCGAASQTRGVFPPPAPRRRGARRAGGRAAPPGGSSPSPPAARSGVSWAPR